MTRDDLLGALFLLAIFVFFFVILLYMNLHPHPKSAEQLCSESGGIPLYEEHSLGKTSGFAYSGCKEKP
jgi:hypothetical protein